MDLAARREARRRKILENTDSRLKKITGVEERCTKSDIDVFRLPQLEENTDLEFSNNSAHSNCIAEPTTNSENGFNGNARTSNVPTPINHIELKRYPRSYYVALISVIFSSLLIISDILKVDIEYLHINIFIPLFAFEILYFCIGPHEIESLTFISMIFGLTNLGSIFEPAHLQYVQKYIYYLFRVIQDMMIYFFIFIICYTFIKLCI